MAQAKRKTATRTAKKTTQRKAGSCRRGAPCCKKKQQQAQRSNPFFVISMGALALTLLIADITFIAL